jgi:hypothetical protein
LWWREWWAAPIFTLNVVSSLFILSTITLIDTLQLWYCIGKVRQQTHSSCSRRLIDHRHRPHLLHRPSIIIISELPS